MQRQSSPFHLIVVVAAIVALLLGGCMAPAAAPSAPAAEYGAAPAAAEAQASAMPADMYFEDYGTQGFAKTALDNLSTFAVDVDTGAYTVARAYLEDGFLPPADAIRAEEFVNYFDYRYPTPARAETFGINLAAAPSPYMERDANLMLQVGIQGYTVPKSERPDVTLTFVIDVSGSMDMENRLHLAKRALDLLVDELRPSDEVAIVVYGDDARLVLPMTSMEEEDAIRDGIARVYPEGSTNAEAGLRLAYRHAAEHYNPAHTNRIVLVSDGVANVGITTPGGILDEIKRYAEDGIALTTIGMGMGNYNDTLMEQLADGGDGFYAYVDNLREARRIFVDQLTGTLLTIGKDAKIQVEFNQDAVERYRLVGYENRDVADDDFRNDEVDAGEIGAGHSVTALYELEPVPGLEDPATPLATVRLRWQELETGEVVEREATLTLGDVTPAFAESELPFQLAVTVAEFAEILKDSPFAEQSTLDSLAEDAERLVEAFEAGKGHADTEVVEFAELVWLAARGE
jgi:Ca-activated chloride channel family protein